MHGAENFDNAVKYISKRIRAFLEEIPPSVKSDTYEIRLRSGRPVSLFGAYGTLFVGCDGKISMDYTSSVISSPEEVRDIFNRICSYSIYTFQRCINRGYIPLENGNRAGVCGTAVCENDSITSVKDITSVNIRLAREVVGCADSIISRADFDKESIIIAGAPSSGKTTLIRDITRQLGGGLNGKYRKICVIDERREISGIMNGVITNDIGITTDVLDSYPKSEAIDIAVRTLSPEIIVCDEVSTEYEINAVKSGVNCGAKFIVTVHAGNEEEIFSRKQIEELISTFSFSKLFLLDRGENIGKIKREYDTGEILNEINRRRNGNAFSHGGGNY